MLLNCAAKPPGGGCFGTGRVVTLVIGGVLMSCGRPGSPVPIEGPRGEIVEAVHEFGEAPQGTVVEHTFVIRNIGSEDLIIESVDAPEMVVVDTLDETVPPGDKGRIRVALETAGRAGAGELTVIIRTNDPEEPEKRVGLRGRLVPVVEIKPKNRVYFFQVLRGETPRQQLTIVNHQAVPLHVLRIEGGDPSVVGNDLETVEDGQTYSLELELINTEKAPNRLEQELTLVTDSPTLPRIPILILATFENRVDARPRKVAWGKLGLEDLSESLPAETEIRIAARDGTDFEVLEASTDLAFVNLEIIPETPGRSYLIHLELNPEKASRGEFAGELTVTTNDPEFPRLTVPLSGTFL